MIFDYEELKSCVSDDFEAFYDNMKFTSEQVIPAILNEYEHAKDYSLTEEICIYISLFLIFEKRRLDVEILKLKLHELLTIENMDMVKKDLKEDYKNFILDIENIKSKYNI